MLNAAKDALKISVLVVLVMVASATYRLIMTLDRVTAEAPAAIRSEVAQTRSELLALTRAEIAGIRRDANAQISGLRRDVMRKTDAVIELADRHIYDSLDRADAAIAEVHSLRSDLAPIIVNVQSITGHIDEASGILLRRDALPAQLLGVTAATKVTMGETAQAMRTVRDALPAFTGYLDAGAKQGAGIAGDLHTITAKIAAPQPWYKKVFGAIKDFGALGVKIGAL